MIKIAAISDDGETLSRHFGRATMYIVVTIKNGVIIDREIRNKLNTRDFQQDTVLGLNEPAVEYRIFEKPESDQEEDKSGSRGHGFGEKAVARHKRMLDNIPDCEIILAGGMGRGLYETLKAQSIYPIITDMTNIDQAIQAVMDDKITFRLDRIH